MADRRSTAFVVIHCSATRPTQNIGAREIRQWHRAKGWSDIGYHFVIRRDGTVENGRPINSIGAHVAGHNANSIAICMVGGISDKQPWKAENNFTREQWAALETLALRMWNKYPSAKFRGHRDFSPDLNKDGKISSNEWIKDCPCFDVIPWARTRNLPV